MYASDGVKKTIIRGNGVILWQHWVDAYEWDQANHCIKVVHNLRAEHFTLDGPSKMRNHLAFEVLNQDMLHLMKVSVLI